MDLLQKVLFESASWLHTNPARSWMTIQQRVEHEGESYLTITLPALESHLLRCIDLGVWIPSRLWKERRGSPVFLQEFLGSVFDFRGDLPRLKNSPEAVLAIRCLRQILGLYAKKFELPSHKRSVSAVEGFFNVERELRNSRAGIRSVLDQDFRLTVETLFGEVFYKSQKDFEDLIFKHGPGMTADRTFGIPKYSSTRVTWTRRLDAVFDVGKVAYLNYSDLALNGDHSVLSPKSETPMRITLVPKTAKMPRIIAMEPTALQWVQQGLLSSLSKRVSESRLTRSCSWDNQERNRSLARKGSKDGSLATLDLSEASDRLHLSVVNHMLKNYPLLRKAVFACRSTQADFFGRNVRLEKFAPMGSAMCFAFESMAFYAIACLGVAQSSRGKSRIRQRDITIASRNVSVYGDDIIVPTDSALVVADLLESFGLLVNRRKSFWTGMFRESCGGDFYNGYDVTIARVRRNVSFNYRECEDFSATVELQNRLFEKNYFQTAEWLASKLEPAGLSYAPPGDRDGLWLYDFHLSGRCRMNPGLQRVEYRTLRREFSRGTGEPDQADLLFHWFNTSQCGPSEREVVPLVRRPKLIRLRRAFLPA